MNTKQILLDKIAEKGGWVNTHAHFDRAYTIDEVTFKQVYAPLKEKWGIVDNVKRTSSVDQIFERMSRATELMIQQGVQAIGTFIDVDEAIEDKSIKAAQKLKDAYGQKVQLKFMNQTLKGVLDKDAKYWFDMGVEFVDIIGGLPAKDAGRESAHLDVLLSTAKKYNKMVHVHVDQFNTDDENETELLAKKTIEHSMEGKVAAIHSISVGAHSQPKRKEIYEWIKKAEMMVISCPIAWIDHPRTEKLAPSHNAITPIDEMLPYGIKVAIGTDNIADVYKPFGDGDMWTELKLVLEACKLYDIDALAEIATSNGLDVLGISH